MRLSLFARMALILAFGLAGTQTVSLWLHWDERASVVAQARGQHLADRIAEVVRVLEAEPPGRRDAALAALQSAELRVQPIDAARVAPHVARGALPATLAERLGGEREIRAPGMGGGMGMGGGGMGAGMGRGRRGNEAWTPDGDGAGAGATAPRWFDIRLADGSWVRILASREADTPALPTGFMLRLLLSLAIIVGVVVVAVRQATRPLREFADAADAFGANLDAPPLPEAGPRETRQAAHAFNRMQQRIRRLVDERARALAAVSHDLRTPLTRLRLRAELVGDTALREQMNDDLDAMGAMIDATLDYLRDRRENEPPRPIDIDALLQSLADDARVLGREVSVEGAAAAPFAGRLTALRRALQNLIDNAVKYGQRARLRCEDSADGLRLIVEDDGPGIPPAELARVTEPFYRLESSRSRETGGVGLGLSIVSDIARLHGGMLELSNLPHGGLRACLALPRPAP